MPTHLVWPVLHSLRPQSPRSRQTPLSTVSSATVLSTSFRKTNRLFFMKCPYTESRRKDCAFWQEKNLLRLSIIWRSMLGALLVLARLLIMKSISSVLGFKIYPRVLFIYQLANWHRSFIVHIKADLNIYKESSNLSQSIPAVTLQRLGYQLLTLHWFTTQSDLEGSHGCYCTRVFPDLYLRPVYAVIYGVCRACHVRLTNSG